jgi:hypothetical protein
VWWFYRWLRLHFWWRVVLTWWWEGLPLSEAREEAAKELLLDLRRAGLDPWSTGKTEAP